MLRFLNHRLALRLSVLMLFVPVFVLACLITLGSTVTLYQGGELRSLEAVVATQARDDRLYNSPARDNRAYKLLLLDHLRPDVVVVGSSRAMLFRETMFAGRFANAGGAVGNLGDLLGFLEALQERDDIDLILLQLDYWWFDNEIFDPGPEGPAYRPGRAVYPWGVNLMAPAFVWLAGDTVLGVDTLLRGVRGRLPLDAATIVSPTGFTARANGTGYAQDGSFYYGASLYCSYDTPARRRILTAADADRRWSEFAHRKPWPEGIAALVRSINALESRGKKVVAFTVPLAPALYVKLRDHVGFLQIMESLTARLPAFTDLHDPAQFEGLDDSGFTDAVHPGESVYPAVLERLAMSHGELGTQLAVWPTGRSDINRVIPESGTIGEAFFAAARRQDPHLAEICQTPR